jgi:hypothetical protein
VYNQIKRAIAPSLALGDLIAGWKTIAEGLAENHRKRTAQVERLFGDRKTS